MANYRIRVRTRIAHFWARVHARFTPANFKTAAAAEPATATQATPLAELVASATPAAAAEPSAVEHTTADLPAADEPATTDEPTAAAEPTTTDEPAAAAETAALVEDLERRLRAAEAAQVNAERTAADAMGLADEVYDRMRAAEEKAAAGASQIAELEARVKELNRQLHAAPAPEPTGAVAEPTESASSGSSGSEARFAFDRRNSARTLVPSDEQSEPRCQGMATRARDKGKGRTVEQVPPQHISFELGLAMARVLEPELLQEWLDTCCKEGRLVQTAIVERFQQLGDVWVLHPLEQAVDKASAIQLEIDADARQVEYLAHMCNIYRAALRLRMAPAA
ncbi:hypothetical protein H4R21_003945 [Coemansia helicoidea]|uniref:Uncharacterized protein n=1 Tax=Coemansia helicoidea TaxID=1286919 RepID=A0ACC1L099_9FUNG|nr:hypothetical protein H4R21_003945 [Coemansia helicoidea]